MAILYKFDNVFSAEKDVYEPPVGIVLAQWMIDTWPEGFGQKFTVYNRAIKEENVIDPLKYTVREDDVFLITLDMEGPAAIAWVAIGLVVATVIYIATLDQETPESPETGSSNNKISGQTNKIRVGERIADMVGTNRSWPDLMYDAADEFLADGRQKITEWMYVGVGLYTLDDMRQGDSLISGDNQTTVTIYQPVADVTTLPFVTEFHPVGQVRSLELHPPDNAPTIDSDNIRYTSTGAETGTVEHDVGVGNTSPFIDSLAAGDAFRVHGDSDSGNTNRTMYVTVVNAIVSGVASIDINVVGQSAISSTGYIDNQYFNTWHKRYRIEAQGVLNSDSSNDTDVLSVIDDVSSTTWDEKYQVVTGDFDGKTMILETENGPTDAQSGVIFADAVTSGATFPRAVQDNVRFDIARTNIGITIWRAFRSPPAGPYALPIDDAEEVWVNIEFPTGLIAEDGGNGFAEFEIFIEGVTNGEFYSTTFAYSRKTRSPVRITEKIVFSDVGLTVGRYTVSLRRSFNHSGESTADDNKSLWTSLAAIRQRVDVDSIGDVTAIKIETIASVNSSRAQTRKFNLLATRELRDFTHFIDQPGHPDHGGWISSAAARGSAALSGARVATNKWINAFMYRATDSYGIAVEDLDVDVSGLQAIQTTLDALDSGEGGEFNFTFDKRLSSNQELKMIGAAARCDVYRIGKKIYCARDEVKALPTAMFQRRNKSPKGETKTFDFNQANKHDHVLVSFRDSETDYKKQTFTYPVSGDPDFNAAIDQGFNPIKLNLEGITNWSQAYRRAVYTYKKDKLQTDSLKLETTDDARILAINDKVLNVDALEYLQHDGEIQAVDVSTPSSSLITLDLPVFNTASSGALVIRDSSGDSTQTFAATEGATKYIAIIDTTSATVDFTTTDGQSIGGLYQFRTSADTSLDEYTVKSIVAGKNYVTVSLKNYSEDVFDADTVTIPAKPY